MGNSSGTEANQTLGQEQTAEPINPVNLAPGEANRFIQAVLHQNEELGIIPQRLLADGNRAVLKATMNKAKVVDMPFDIEIPSLKMARENFDGSRVKLKFLFDSYVGFSANLHLGVVQKRHAEDSTDLPDIVRYAEKSSSQYDIGKKSQGEISCNYLASMLTPPANLSEDEEFFDGILILSRKFSVPQKREISNLYIYLSISKPTDSGATQFSLMCQKKGRSILTRNASRKEFFMDNEYILASE